MGGAYRVSEYHKQWREKNADRVREQQRERDRKKREARNASPEALAAYKAKRRLEWLKKHPGAKTREEIQANKKARVAIPKGDTRKCCDCGEEKAIALFPKHGGRGHKAFCMACRDIRAKKTRRESQRAYEARNRDKVNATKREWAKRQQKPDYDALEIKLNGPKKKAGFTTLKSEGWRLVLSFGDSHEIIKVYMKGLLIRYMRMPATGQYSTGKTSYGIAFDNSGKRYPKLSLAEKAV